MSNFYFRKRSINKSNINILFQIQNLMIKKALNLFGLLMLLPISASGINTLGNYVNPVIKSIFPDPTVIRAQDGAFYTASTAGLTPVYKSYNLCDWTYVGNAFTEETKPSYGHI